MTASLKAPVNPRTTTFVGSKTGSMRVVTHATLSGQPIASVDAVDMITGSAPNLSDGAIWAFHGVTSNDRYTTRSEKIELTTKQPAIGRSGATAAALILLRKRPEWWTLTQDERRAILKDHSHHIAIGMRYLPAITGRLLHCRDLDCEAPFDFIGFLDYSPENRPAFDELLGQLWATKEWSFMDRETDIRLDRGYR